MDCALPPRRSGRLTALTSVALAGLLLLAAGSSAVPAQALEAGTAGAAAANQDGWWNRLQGPQEGEPPGNPLRAAAPALPTPPTIPADAIVAGVALGQPMKVAAVGIEIALPQGGMVDSLTLHLKESPGTGANINSAAAKAMACPAVTPWGPHKNGAWQDRPEADCAQGQADGVRAEDGTWMFDLTPLAALWADPFAASLGQNGVVLALDPAASPGVAQVSWLDITTGEVVLELVASVLPDALSDLPSPGFGSEGAPTLDGAPLSEVPYEPSYEAALIEPEPSGFSDDPLSFSTGEVPYFEPAPADVPAPAAEESTALLAAAPPGQPRAPALRAQVAVGFWDDVPAPTALLVPVVLGLALLVGLALGPGGRPLPVWARAGGLSRALARRSGGNSAV
ncbi:MAG TPA: hypothetical protein VI854_00275 [Acidimicrobiia bacterium]|nr:hypothetical protein [Acidimicrobiia bacterium]